jgi:hypothetical protein
VDKQLKILILRCRGFAIRAKFFPTHDSLLQIDAIDTNSVKINRIEILLLLDNLRHKLQICASGGDFETGNLIGLESKTSSPIQVLREKNGLCTGFENLYFIGEGSGYAGGIISSGADGIKAAMGFVLEQ